MKIRKEAKAAMQKAVNEVYKNDTGSWKHETRIVKRTTVNAICQLEIQQFNNGIRPSQNWVLIQSTGSNRSSRFSIYIFFSIYAKLSNSFMVTIALRKEIVMIIEILIIIVLVLVIAKLIKNK